MSPLPQTLAILPLAERVLLPHIETTYTVTNAEARFLQRNECDYIVCIPVQGSDSETAVATTDLSKLFSYGCVAKILHIDRSFPDTTVLRVRGICRSYVKDILCNGDDATEAVLEHYPEPKQVANSQAHDQFRGLYSEYIARMRDIGIPDSVLSSLQRAIHEYPMTHLVNLTFCLFEAKKEDKLRALETLDLDKRVQHGIDMISRQLQILHKQQQHIEEILDKRRREFYLRQQSHTIAKESLQSSSSNTGDGNGGSIINSFSGNNSSREFFLRPADQDDEELVSLVERLNKANLPEYAQTVVQRDLKRLRSMSSSTPESGVLRSYLELVADLPWSSSLQQPKSNNVNIKEASKLLDEHHYGLEHVKKRILEYLSVIKIKNDLSPPILCLVGPPGVGKTTLAKSIAEALQRKFHRISLGSIRDEADIRGHRRTYVAAMPGLLINGMRRCGVSNPVILLDEIDKVLERTQQGDPAAAMLEVLDPAQNTNFVDHYLNIPFDLSQVLFIATANSLDTISGPLLDRMEVIQLEGYTLDEKQAIARSYLLPKQLEAHGLTQCNVQVTQDALLYMIEHYTMESGIRNLERNIASICRAKCKEYADLLEAKNAEKFCNIVTQQDVATILGMPLYEPDNLNASEAVPGIVNGMAYSSSGIGGVLPIEASQMPGQGQIRLTGSLGDVIKESAYIAVSWIKSNAFALRLTNSRKQVLLQDMDLHIHMPSGAVPKDGPSAGVALVICIMSLLSGEPVSRTTAMSGEITLRGQVRPVGGIKEKVISAHRAGVERILLPAGNQRDVVQTVPPYVQNSVSFIYCKTIWDAVEAVFTNNSLTQHSAQCVSRL